VRLLSCVVQPGVGVGSLFCSSTTSSTLGKAIGYRHCRSGRGLLSIDSFFLCRWCSVLVCLSLRGLTLPSLLVFTTTQSFTPKLAYIYIYTYNHFLFVYFIHLFLPLLLLPFFAIQIFRFSLALKPIHKFSTLIFF